MARSAHAALDREVNREEVIARWGPPWLDIIEFHQQEPEA